eukprot:CAMPEP_0171461564 /NCGR_PEP_ID=MMETSP0945-20130129/5959_1 /TAXON_ID=109269 /ORGANISM="Vaucheria litorea, Strain CCMP2940" /LENGTH=179 /DNA_ID=CAMNT_0011987931 /DNA_START=213 /DNA_END=752 /DNA_ORIENTATION=-
MADASKLQGKAFGQDSPIFDPLGLASKATDDELMRYQEAEIKHGRIAMLATAGALMQEKHHPIFPESMNVGPAIDHLGLVLNEYSWVFILMVIAASAHEFENSNKIYKPATNTRGLYSEFIDDRIPGSLNFDPFDLAKSMEPDKYNAMRTKEINNGRLAMIAVAGIVGQELANHRAIIN